MTLEGHAAVPMACGGSTTRVPGGLAAGPAELLVPGKGCGDCCCDCVGSTSILGFRNGGGGGSADTCIGCAGGGRDLAGACCCGRGGRDLAGACLPGVPTDRRFAGFCSAAKSR